MRDDASITYSYTFNASSMGGSINWSTLGQFATTAFTYYPVQIQKKALKPLTIKDMLADQEED